MSNPANPPAALAAGALPQRLLSLRNALAEQLVERDPAIRLALLATLAGEHLLLMGPPGTAKSLVARRLHLAFASATYFERLLTRFTVPEELFGPLSIKGLEEDRYERLTRSYLPSASIAFLDEIFKANSAILNALLTLLNEREFDNGTQREKTPLLAVIGASNELPDSEELAALYDRFLLRLYVGPVSKEGFRSLLGLRGQPVPKVEPSLCLSTKELAEIQGQAEKVEVPEDVVALLCELRDWCTAQNLSVSDRRWRKIVKLLQVSAVTNGRMKVSIWDCWLLQHCVWEQPEQAAEVYAWYAARVGTSAAMDPSRLTRIVVAWEATLKRDQESRSQARDEQGRLLYVREDGKDTIDQEGLVHKYDGKQPLYLAPPNSWTPHYGRTPITDRTNQGKGYIESDLNRLYVDSDQFQYWRHREAYLSNPANRMTEPSKLPPKLEPTRHKAPYLHECLREIDTLKTEVTTYQTQLNAHIKTLEADIRSHLWVDAAFVEPATQALQGTAHEVKTLLGRIDRLRKGFEMLPREDSPKDAGKLATAKELAQRRTAKS